MFWVIACFASPSPLRPLYVTDLQSTSLKFVHGAVTCKSKGGLRELDHTTHRVPISIYKR